MRALIYLTLLLAICAALSCAEVLSVRDSGDDLLSVDAGAEHDSESPRMKRQFYGGYGGYSPYYGGGFYRPYPYYGGFGYGGYPGFYGGYGFGRPIFGIYG